LVLTTPNGMIANKDDVIIKLHSKYHITEYFPQEVAGMLKGIGMEVSQVLANKRAQGGLGIHANPLRRMVIGALHRAHLIGIASRCTNGQGGGTFSVNGPFSGNQVDS